MVYFEEKSNIEEKSQIPTIFLSICIPWRKCSYIILLMYIRENYYLCMLVKTYLYVTTNMQWLVEAHLYFAINIHGLIKIYLCFTININREGTSPVYLFIYALFYVDIYNKKHKNSDLYNSLYTNSYTNGIQKTDMYANLHQPE